MEFSERNLLEMLSSKYDDELIYINHVGRNVIDYVVLWERL